MSEPLSGPVYLKAEAVAQRFEVSLKTVRRWTRAGRLPALTLPGGTVRYRPDRLETWEAARTHGTRNHVRLAPSPARKLSAGKGSAHA